MHTGKDFSLHWANNGRYFSSVSLVAITFQVDLLTKIGVFNLCRGAMFLFVLQRSSFVDSEAQSLCIWTHGEHEEQLV